MDILTAWQMLDSPATFAELETAYKRNTDGAPAAALALYDEALEVLYSTEDTAWPKAEPEPDPQAQPKNNGNGNGRAADPYPDAKDASEDPRAAAVIEKIMNLEGIEIEICGRWVWAGGETRQHRDALKAAGMFFARKKAKWYWRPPEHKARRKGRKGMPMEHIRQKYGSRRPRIEEE
mgnify:CR=1 FL=1